MSTSTSPWIALSTRRPTQADLTESGDVLEYCDINSGVRHFVGPFLTAEAGYTHWRMVPRPALPAKPTQRELDERDILAYWRGQSMDFAQTTLFDLEQGWGMWLHGWRDCLKWQRLTETERERRRSVFAKSE